MAVAGDVWLHLNSVLVWWWCVTCMCRAGVFHTDSPGAMEVVSAMKLVLARVCADELPLSAKTTVQSSPSKEASLQPPPIAVPTVTACGHALAALPYILCSPLANLACLGFYALWWLMSVRKNLSNSALGLMLLIIFSAGPVSAQSKILVAALTLPLSCQDLEDGDGTFLLPPSCPTISLSHMCQPIPYAVSSPLHHSARCHGDVAAVVAPCRPRCARLCSY